MCALSREVGSQHRGPRHRTSSSCPMLWPLMTPKDTWWVFVPNQPAWFNRCCHLGMQVSAKKQGEDIPLCIGSIGDVENPQRRGFKSWWAEEEMRPNWPCKSRRTNCRVFEFAHRKKEWSIFPLAFFAKHTIFCGWFLGIPGAASGRSCTNEMCWGISQQQHLGGFRVQFWNSLLDFEVIGVDKERVEPLQLVKYLPGECPPKKIILTKTSGALSLKSCIPYLSLYYIYSFRFCGF